MKHSEGTIISSDGVELYYQRWLPDIKPRAGVAILHGIGGHSGQSTYTHLINHLVPLGYALYGLDLRGHGRSGGRRGSINKWEEYRDDLQAFLCMIKEQESNQTVFAVGQSLGGLIVLEFALHYPQEVKGVIVSAPGLSEPDISPIRFILLQTLSSIWPHLTLNPKLDLSGVSRDPKEVEKMHADPLTDPKYSPRFAMETLSALQWTHANAADFKVPIMIIHGSADPLTSPKGSQTFFEHITIEDKTLKLYEGGYHQSFIDVNRDEVLRDVVNWLDRHVKSQ